MANCHKNYTITHHNDHHCTWWSVQCIYLISLRILFCPTNWHINQWLCELWHAIHIISNLQLRNKLGSLHVYQQEHFAFWNILTISLPLYFLTIIVDSLTTKDFFNFSVQQGQRNLPLGSSQNLLWLRFKSLNAIEKKEIIRPTKLIKLGRACQWRRRINLYLKQGNPSVVKQLLSTGPLKDMFTNKIE